MDSMYTFRNRYRMYIICGICCYMLVWYKTSLYISYVINLQQAVWIYLLYCKDCTNEKNYWIWFLPTSWISSCSISQSKIFSINWLLSYRFFQNSLVTAQKIKFRGILDNSSNQINFSDVKDFINLNKKKKYDIKRG